MSNIVKASPIPAKMDTKEIASVASKEHKQVLRETRVMLVTLFGGDYVDSVIPADKASQRAKYIWDNLDAIFEAVFRDGVNSHHQQNQGFTLHWDVRGYLSLVELNRNLTLTLVSGYDIHLRNRIISRLEELEQAAALPKSAPSKPARASVRYREAAAITRDQLKICKLLGVDEGMAKVITAKEVRDATGLDFTPLLTNVTATNNPRLTVTELVERIEGATSEMVNNALEDLGFQTKKRWTSRGKPRSKWLLTEAGKQYGALAPYQAEEHEHSGMRPVWFASVLELIQPLVDVAIVQRAAAKAKRRKKKSVAPDPQEALPAPQKGEELNGGNRQLFDEDYAAATAKSS